MQPLSAGRWACRHPSYISLLGSYCHTVKPLQRSVLATALWPLRSFLVHFFFKEWRCSPKSIHFKMNNQLRCEQVTKLNQSKHTVAPLCVSPLSHHALHSRTLSQVSRSTMAAVMTMEPAALSFSTGSPNGSGIQWQNQAHGGYESSPECQVNFTGHWRVSGSPSKPGNMQRWPHRDDERLPLSLILQAIDLFNDKTPSLNFVTS